MRTMTVIKSLLAATALAALATGCAGDKAGTGSARELVEAAGHGVDMDYTPLTSPKDAVGKADLIVEGTVVDVTGGIQVRYPDKVATQREANDYATFVIAVDKVIDGDAGSVVGGKVYVAVSKSTNVTSAQLAALNPQARVVAVLDDITTWRPTEQSTVARPAAVPGDAPLFMPYTDGMWLQGEGDSTMLSISAHQLEPGWGRVTTVPQFAAKVEQAATGG